MNRITPACVSTPNVEGRQFGEGRLNCKPTKSCNPENPVNPV